MPRGLRRVLSRLRLFGNHLGMTTEYMKYLGIDWGLNKIGLAIGDDEVKVASPFDIILLGDKGDKGDITNGWIELKKVIRENDVKKIIIGRPVSLGGDAAMKQAWQMFVDAVSGLGATVEFEDERMSTKMAQKLKRDFSFAKKKQGDDDVAAAIILQSYFDRL